MAELDKTAEKLACEIALGPLIIKTEASLDQVSELILRLVREYREAPKGADGH